MSVIVGTSPAGNTQSGRVGHRAGPTAEAGRRARKEGGLDDEARRARVLVIDEDQASRNTITEAIAAQGYEVWAEPDGRAIEEAFAQFAPDLVILEVHFANGPGGYTLARRLREERDVAVVLVSSADSAEARLAAFEAGADDYVAKPLPVPELLARVEALLRRSRRSLTGSSRSAVVRPLLAAPSVYQRGRMA